MESSERTMHPQLLCLDCLERILPMLNALAKAYACVSTTGSAIVWCTHVLTEDLISWSYANRDFKTLRATAHMRSPIQKTTEADSQGVQAEVLASAVLSRKRRPLKGMRISGPKPAYGGCWSKRLSASGSNQDQSWFPCTPAHFI